MPNDERGRRRIPDDLPDEVIAKYLPAGVPLRTSAEPVESLTGWDRRHAESHRRLIVGHAAVCMAIEAYAESSRQNVMTTFDEQIRALKAEWEPHSARNRALLKSVLGDKDS